jgi:hypothetical protein
MVFVVPFDEGSWCKPLAKNSSWFDQLNPAEIQVFTG